MASDVILIMRTIITEIWRFLTSWYIPGFNFTPAQLIMFILLFPVIINAVFAILSVNVLDNKHDDKRR